MIVPDVVSRAAGIVSVVLALDMLRKLQDIVVMQVQSRRSSSVTINHWRIGSSLEVARGGRSWATETLVLLPGRHLALTRAVPGDVAASTGRERLGKDKFGGSALGTETMSPDAGVVHAE